MMYVFLYGIWKFLGMSFNLQMVEKHALAFPKDVEPVENYVLS